MDTDNDNDRQNLRERVTRHHRRAIVKYDHYRLTTLRNNIPESQSTIYPHSKILLPTAFDTLNVRNKPATNPVIIVDSDTSSDKDDESEPFKLQANSINHTRDKE